jgi:hypothetical protein
MTYDIIWLSKNVFMGSNLITLSYIFFVSIYKDYKIMSL